MAYYSQNYAGILGSAQLSGLCHHVHCIWKILQLCCECEAVAWSGDFGIDWHSHRWDCLSTMSALHSKAIIKLELSCVCVRSGSCV